MPEGGHVLLFEGLEGLSFKGVAGEVNDAVAVRCYVCGGAADDIVCEFMVVGAGSPMWGEVALGFANRVPYFSPVVSASEPRRKCVYDFACR